MKAAHFLQGPVNEDGLAVYFLAGYVPPGAAVAGLGPVVAQNEVLSLGYDPVLAPGVHGPPGCIALVLGNVVFHQRAIVHVYLAGVDADLVARKADDALDIRFRRFARTPEDDRVAPLHLAQPELV